MKRILKYVSSIAALTSTAAASLYFSGYLTVPGIPERDTLVRTDTLLESSPAPEPSPPPPPKTFHYIEIINTCGPHFGDGPCVNLRAGPGTEYPIVLRLRTGMVFKVEEATVEGGGLDWYKIILDEKLRYPERVTSDWYVAKNDEVIRPFEDVGEELLRPGKSHKTSKRIVVDLSESMLYAYDGVVLAMETPISPGKEDTPTPRGTFSIYRKTPTRYMQGPLPGITDSQYDLPGIPWDLYFSSEGAAIHGAYWHNDFGEARSHGCVNLPPEKAKELYEWADLGMLVIVQD